MKKNVKGYISYIGIMAVLVIVAMFLPQIVFQIQDRYQMAGIKVEKRENITFSQMNMDYKTSMYDRMEFFASMDKNNIYVTDIAYDITEKTKLQNLLTRVLNQDWFSALNEVTMRYFHEELEKGNGNLTDCKKYVVYGDNYQQGVALVVWYLELYVEESDTGIQILVDSETESVYYAVITAAGEIMYDAEDKKKGASAYGISVKEATYFMADRLAGCMEFYTSYYGGQKKDSERKSDIREQNCMLEYPLSYGDYSLKFEFEAEYRQGICPDISMGIAEIRDVIPEMVKDKSNQQTAY